MELNYEARRSKMISGLRKKILALVVLNITDLLATVSMIRTGFTREANPLMINIINDPMKIVLIKIILPTILLAFVAKRIEKATTSQIKISDIVLTVALVIYGLINISHIVWFILYVFYTVWN